MSFVSRLHSSTFCKVFQMILPTKKKTKVPSKTKGLNLIFGPLPPMQTQTDRYLAIQRGEFSPLQI